ncbi:MAG: hypothetical protein K9J17_05455 [Flavobacteriales bacterium]|nr:hypothetical protein [Flavobacteriales bacterium]
MKLLSSFITLALAIISFNTNAQAPVSIDYHVAGNVDANSLSLSSLEAAPKECVIDFHFSAPSVRVIMESPDGLTNYVDRVFPLEVQAFPDSTYVYGKPGAWTIGLGQFENVSAFRVKLVNANTPLVGPTVAQGTYP